MFVYHVNVFHSFGNVERLFHGIWKSSNFAEVKF